MSVLQGIFLGMVQGLAEFLPISSSGHLMLFRKFMGISDTTGAYFMFDILLHVGTLLVVLIVFWKDWLSILKNPFKSKTLLQLFVASLPAFVFVLLFKNVVDVLETGKFLGVSFIITGLLLFLSQKLSQIHQNKEKSFGIVNALTMGITQILGLFPGVSRSGSTIFGGILSKVNKTQAAKFSFMMSAPAIVGSLLFELRHAVKDGYIHQLELLPTLFGMLFAFTFGFIAIRFMLKLISKISLNWFAIYVSLLGILVCFGF